MGVQRDVRVVLDVQRSGFEPRSEVVVRQYDKGARLLIDVLDGGAALAADGVEAHLMCDTRGGLVESALERGGQAWVYTLGQDLTAFHGLLRPYVELRRGGEVIAATGSFDLRVDRAADLTAGQAEASQSRLDEAEGAWKAFNAAAEVQESAREAAEGERRSAEAAREEAERARADEWAGASLSVGEVTSAAEPSASIREGPGGRLDLVLDLALVPGRDGDGAVAELTDAEIDEMFSEGGDAGEGGGAPGGGWAGMTDEEIDGMFSE